MILQHKGINLFYTDTGEGSAIVLLHGFLENASMWDTITPHFSKRNRVICIDLLGHGQTECLGYVHTMEAMAEAVDTILQHLKIRRSIVIGHSMGGYVALAFAEAHPDAVKGLCLLNSTARADSAVKRKNRDRAVKIVKQNHKSFIRIAIADLFRPKNRTIFSKEVRQAKKEALKTPLQGIVAALEGMKIRNDREVLLHFSPYKKMMILGKKDPVLAYPAILEQLINTEVALVELPDGHMSHIENFEETLKAIKSFVKSCN